MTWLIKDLEEVFPAEAEQVLAKEIATKTGILPVVTTAFDKGTKHREPVTYKVLRFWMRDRDGMIISRDIDLREFHPKEGVKHALRAVVRIARLDHVGLPIEAPSNEQEIEFSAQMTALDPALAPPAIVKALTAVATAMTVDEARRVARGTPLPGGEMRLHVAIVVALAEVDRLTADRAKWMEENCDIGEELAACRETNAKIAAEVDRLRSLPVITTCGDCSHMGHTSGDSETCDHGDAPVGVSATAPLYDVLPHVSQRDAPPPWCPLRKPR